MNSFKTGEVLMDGGSIHKTLLVYALPVLLMQLLQQLYNIADCAVIGRLCGGFGLAAVGVAGLVLAVHINFFIGFSVGVTSAVSRLFGARDFGKLHAMIATSVWLAAGAGLFLTLLGERLGESYLTWLACPPKPWATRCSTFTSAFSASCLSSSITSPTASSAPSATRERLSFGSPLPLY